MVLSTPNERYDTELAAGLLRSVGESEASSAMDNLLSRNVVSKLKRDPKRMTPGRSLKISEMSKTSTAFDCMY